jgi:hypothetical protein
MFPRLDSAVQQVLQRGVVIPASPLALNARRQLDERRQRALWRYYSAAGAGGVAVAVHTTQFAIRDPKIGLLRPILALAAEEFSRLDAGRTEPLVRIAGVCGRTEQAVSEAAQAREFGFHAGLLSLGALRDAGDDALLAHCRAVAEVIPLMGFYLQPAVGGRVLPYAFWRRFLEIENVAAIKIAPFNRYQTLDVMRAVAESGRADVALYTGNDDNIVVDLITPYRFQVGGRVVERRIVGGLLGHWAVWTRSAVELLEQCWKVVTSFPLTEEARHESAGPLFIDALNEAHVRVVFDVPPLPEESRRAAEQFVRTMHATGFHPILSRAVEVTDANAALFDAANGFAGCIAGLHEVLRRQGLLEGIWCLDPNETLSPGQSEEIDRIYRMYPHLADDEFVAEHRDEWLNP